LDTARVTLLKSPMVEACCAECCLLRPSDRCG